MLPLPAHILHCWPAKHSNRRLLIMTHSKIKCTEMLEWIYNLRIRINFLSQIRVSKIFFTVSTIIGFGIVKENGPVGLNILTLKLIQLPKWRTFWHKLNFSFSKFMVAMPWMGVLFTDIGVKIIFGFQDLFFIIKTDHLYGSAFVVLKLLSIRFSNQ